MNSLSINQPQFLCNTDDRGSTLGPTNQPTSLPPQPGGPQANHRGAQAEDESLHEEISGYQARFLLIILYIILLLFLYK
jgi:hypothetical protein